MSVVLPESMCALIPMLRIFMILSLSECLLLEDCCGATDVGNHKAAIHMIKMQGGVFGSVATSSSLLAALK